MGLTIKCHTCLSRMSHRRCLLLGALLLVLVFTYSNSPAWCSLSSGPPPLVAPLPQVQQDVQETCNIETGVGHEATEPCVRQQQQKSNNKTTNTIEAKEKPQDYNEIFELKRASEHDKSDPSQSWRFRYFEEPTRGFSIKVNDDSLDERLANVVYTIVSSRPVNVDFFTFNSGDARQDALNMELVAGPQVDEKACGRHLEEMLELLDEINLKLETARNSSSAATKVHFDEKHVRLARVLDSYGRYESGHLAGKILSPGQFDQCTGTHLLLSNGDNEPNTHLVSTGYCMAKMDLSKHLNANLKARVKSSYEAQGTVLGLGICLPRTCHTKTFEQNRHLIQRLVDSQFQLPESLFIERTLKIDSLYCTVDSESEYARLPLSGKLALGFLLGWFALTLYATFSSASKSATKEITASKPTFLDCINLRRSWQDFVGDRDDSQDPAARAAHESQLSSRKVELDVLNPIKVFGCAFVVLGHSLVLLAAISQDGLKAFYQIETDPAVLMLIVGTNVVDTFFVITGILMGYVVMRRAHRQQSLSQASGNETSKQQANGSSTADLAKQGEEKRPKKPSQVVQFFTQWIKFTVTRHLRLVPLFFLFFWFKKTVFISSFATWPLWDAGFNRDTNYGACRLESWTTPFSVMAAFLPLSKQCVPQAWSLATDLFFSMVIPPVMLIMPRKPKLALAIGVAMIAASNAWALSAYTSVDPYMAYEMNDLRSHGFASMFGPIHHLYTYPHFRVCSVLIGLAAGYFLYFFNEQSGDNNSKEFKEWPRWFKGTATKLSAGTLIIVLLGFSFTPSLKYYVAPHHQGIFTNLFTSGRIVWAACNSVLFMRMASDWRHNFLMKTFSGRFWQALVRLNLAILLIHMDILLYFMASGTTLDYFSKKNILGDFGQAYFYCIPLAVVLHVVYENPIDKLIKRFVMPKLFSAQL